MAYSSTARAYGIFFVKYGIKPCYASVAHPQSNGLVEAINKTLRESVMKPVNASKLDGYMNYPVFYEVIELPSIL